MAASQTANSCSSSLAVNNKNLNLFQVQFNQQCVEHKAENPEGKAEKQKENTDNRTRK